MKSKITNIIFFLVIVLLIIPQTRKPIQVLLHKAVALVNPVSSIDENERIKIDDFDWKLRNENDTTVNLKQFQGKVILINFWATWCPPCIAEMPSLQKLYDKYGNKIEFLFVTNDPLDEKVISFKTKKEYTFPVFQGISNPKGELITSSIPRTLLIDKNGKIVIDKSGAVNWFDVDIQNQIDFLLK